MMVKISLQDRVVVLAVEDLEQDQVVLEQLVKVMQVEVVLVLVTLVAVAVAVKVDQGKMVLVQQEEMEVLDLIGRDRIHPVLAVAVAVATLVEDLAEVEQVEVVTERTVVFKVITLVMRLQIEVAVAVALVVAVVVFTEAVMVVLELLS